jgi:putative sigma-54 modulation protein
MKLVVNTKGFDADAELLDFFQKKADKLDTFFDRIVQGEAYMKHNNTEGIDNKTVELKLFVPGTSMFSSHQAPTWQEGIDEVVDQMRRQLKRYKDKMAEKKPI